MPATFKNNIVWANTANGLPNQIELPAGVAVTYCDVEGDYTGDGNISTDPSFVSTEFVESFEFFDDFDEPNLDEWSVVAGDWSVGSGQLQNIPGSPPDELSHDENPGEQDAADVDLWFSYIRKNAAIGEPNEWKGQLTIYFRFDDDPGETRRAALTIRENRINLWEWVSSSVPAQYSLVENLVDSDQDVEYNVRLQARGPSVQVWWGPEGGSMTQILGTSGFTVLHSKSFNIRVQELGHFALDDILIEGKNNLGEFLHLDEDSPCIDMGDTPVENFVPIVFRDFDDMKGPLDADGLDTVDNDLVLIERDIGADEWPQPEASSFWWQNF